MNVRSVTIFAPVVPREVKALNQLAEIGSAARETLANNGREVQTVRLATPPWPRCFDDPAVAVEVGKWLDQEAPRVGIDYLSFGPVEAAEGDCDESISASTALLAATERLFCSAIVADADRGINVAAARASAKVIEANSRLEPNGFGNLRFAALANVGAGSPFFPAAYSDPAQAGARSAPVSFALALESADLAMEAFAGAATLAEAAQRLKDGLEETARDLVGVMEPLAAELNVRFGGLDFSLAPFPDEANSIAGALESLGAAPFGAMGTLALAALTTQTLQEAAYPRCGFSGLMLPVLEDTVLAARAGAGTYNLHSLLLYSAVCGTGLDTVPLPGDIEPDTLAAILLDVASLAVRLNKPLTARLMPVPGKQAGEPTTFDFPFFANAAILGPVPPAGGALLADGQLRLRPRPR